MMTTASKARAAGYVRRSADDPRSVSLEVQREAIESAAREAGYDYDPRRDLYDEGMGTSGQTMMAERDAGSRLLADLPEYDAVIVYGQDRLARGDLQWALAAQSFRAAGVEVVGVQDDIDLGRASGRFKSSIMAALGGYHAEVTGEKMRDSHRQRAEQGYYRGGPVPYGWRLAPTDDGAHKRLVLDEHEAAVLREAVERYLRGESARAIAVDFNKRGLRRRQGGQWESRYLTRSFRHPRMRGWSTYPEHTPNAPAIVRDDAGKPVQFHEPLVSASEWRALQTRLEEQAGCGRNVSVQRGDGGRRYHLLTGLARCGECKAPMHASSAGARASYQCSNRRHGPDACPGTSFKSADLEGIVLWEVGRRLLLVAEHEPQRLRGVLDEASEDDASEEAVALEDEAERIASALERLEADRLAGLYDGPDAERRFRDQHRRLMEEQREVADRREALEAPDPEADQLRALVGDMFPEGTMDADAVAAAMVMNAQLEDEDQSQRRALLRALVDRVEVSKGYQHRGVADPLKRAERIRVVYSGPLRGIVGHPHRRMVHEIDQGPVSDE